MYVKLFLTAVRKQTNGLCELHQLSQWKTVHRCLYPPNRGTSKAGSVNVCCRMLRLGPAVSYPSAAAWR